MTRQNARLMAYKRAASAGLDDSSADTIVHRVMEIFHEEFTKREWENFIDLEIQRHTAP
jgi:hypothetical protein